MSCRPVVSKDVLQKLEDWWYTIWYTFMLEDGFLSKLTAKFIESISEPKVFTDGDGLQLKVARKTSGQLSKVWQFRYSFNNERGLMGLGAYSKSNSLKVARDKALELNGLLAKDINPKQAKDAEKNKFQEEQAKKRRKAQASANTFEYVADEWWHASKSQWSNAKHAQQNISTLQAYVFPIVGDMPIQNISNNDVLRCLKPIWETKTDTASKVRQRMEKVFNYAKAKGLRTGENPAQWKNNLQMLLPPPEKLKRIQALDDPNGGHFPSMPYEELPQFIVKLKKRIDLNNSIAAPALYLMILTGLRTNPIVKARWDEFDMSKSVWTVPARNQKDKKTFAVPLTTEVKDLIKSLRKVKASDYLFPSPINLDKPIAEGTLLPYLQKKMDYPEYTVHGFRSSFRTWAAEATTYPRELAEYALSHSVGSKVERAYARTDMFKERAKLMEDWARFITGHE